MLLADNITILKKVFPLTWASIKKVENNLDKNLVKLESTKNGQKTLLINKEDKSIYMHSKYNPIREVDTIVEEYKNIEPNSSVIFYGAGLGYHIDTFLEKYPDVNYYIYEPIPEILYEYLSNKEIKDLPSKRLKNIVTTTGKQIISIFLNEVINKSTGKIELVTLPIHKQLFPEEYKEFLQLYKEIVKGKMTNIAAENIFQKRWILNSMKNFKEVLSTPNIMVEKKGQFKGKTALLVAAGPSLNEELENIRYIKENGLAYIFSVGTTVNTLINNNIYPDATTTYDPKQINQIAVKKIKENGITEIPLIFGSSVGYETIENYPGKKYHMLTNQDTVSSFYARTMNNKPIARVYDAPTISVITLQLLYNLGFSTVILVGQNLAYLGSKRYSSGSVNRTELNEKEKEKAITIKDVYGNETLTNSSYISMKEQLEFYIRIFEDMRVINSTKGGAHINGTTFIELSDVIGTHLTNKIVEKDWLECKLTEYDIDYLSSQSKKMDKEYEHALKLIKEYYKVIESIKTFINNKNYSQAEKMYSKLDKVFSKIENNSFFTTFIIPRNRVIYKALVDSIDSLNEEKDKALKGNRIINSFKNFMDLCKDDIDDLLPAYEELKNNIQEYINSTC
ncbi:hypothetical protein DW1_0293 [Proteiniborus sp. DW1]|uniref:motility associated factor glycosyltransferase family protein n=1 Tax=Proteiniborus sp. DW1 TaxID=1889883 RepID=UPI00092E191B|nr:6-hydroxymethylpterin diphosphokinase MptE-like protein [Proteiniborus sp. DW1]SCG81913.1 hypothetical protein DW1_0293 [Proteiniborus sp. DW1]